MIPHLDVSLLHRRSPLEQVLRPAVTWMLRAVLVATALLAAAAAAPATRVVLVGGIGVGGLAAVQAARAWARRSRADRLRAFATRNALQYLPAAGWDTSNSVLSHVANARTVDVMTTSTDTVQLTVGTVEFQAERAGTWVMERWGLIEWRFAGGPLPHIFAQAVGPRSRSLPATLDADQRHLLEGDFPRHFSVFCRPGSERDALYILTPDLMADLVDHGSGASLEITTGTVRLLSPGAFDATDARAWARVERLITLVGEKSLQRARRLARSAGADVPAPPEHPSLDRTPSLVSTSRSNRSTTLVEAAAAAVVIAVFVWVWLH